MPIETSSLGLLLPIILLKLAFLAGFIWAWRQGQFENLEFTKYKVFNDSGPGEPHPSPWNRMEREMNPVWIPVLLGFMLAWFLVILVAMTRVLGWG